MSYYASPPFNETPVGSYASNLLQDGRFSQRYYQSSSLASALTPVASNSEESRTSMWPQQTLEAGYAQDHKGWYAEHRIHSQAIPRSASVMPERRMNSWNLSSGLNGGLGGNPLSPDCGPRRAATPGPSELYQPPQQRHISSSKLREPLNVHGADPYYFEPTQEQLYPRSFTNAHAPPPNYIPESSNHHITDRYRPIYSESPSSPNFPIVEAEDQDGPTIHCPHSWCKSTFTRTNDLTRHLATASIHKQSAPVDPSKVCRMCGEVFSRSDARNRHEIKRSCGRKKPRVPKNV